MIVSYNNNIYQYGNFGSKIKVKEGYETIRDFSLYRRCKHIFFRHN